MKKKLNDYKVIAKGPDSSVTFFVYGAVSALAAQRKVSKDETKKTILRKERIYKLTKENTKVVKIKYEKKNDTNV